MYAERERERETNLFDHEMAMPIWIYNSKGQFRISPSSCRSNLFHLKMKHNQLQDPNGENKEYE